MGCKFRKQPSSTFKFQRSISINNIYYTILIYVCTKYLLIYLLSILARPHRFELRRSVLETDMLPLNIIAVYQDTDGLPSSVHIRARQDSNLHPPLYQSGALTIKLHSRIWWEQHLTLLCVSFKILVDLRSYELRSCSVARYLHSHALERLNYDYGFSTHNYDTVTISTQNSDLHGVE